MLFLAMLVALLMYCDMIIGDASGPSVSSNSVLLLGFIRPIRWKVRRRKPRGLSLQVWGTNPKVLAWGPQSALTLQGRGIKGHSECMSLQGAAACAPWGVVAELTAPMTQDVSSFTPLHREPQQAVHILSYTLMPKLATSSLPHLHLHLLLCSVLLMNDICNVKLLHP